MHKDALHTYTKACSIHIRNMSHIIYIKNVKYVPHVKYVKYVTYMTYVTYGSLSLPSFHRQCSHDTNEWSVIIPRLKSSHRPVLNKFLVKCDSCEHVRAQFYWMAVKPYILSQWSKWHNTLHVYWIHSHVDYRPLCSTIFQHSNSWKQDAEFNHFLKKRMRARIIPMKRRTRLAIMVRRSLYFGQCIMVSPDPTIFLVREQNSDSFLFLYLFS